MKNSSPALLVYGIVLLTLGGCLSPSPNRPSVTSTSISTIWSENATEPRTVAFNECHGLGTAHLFPGDTSPGQPPANWSQHQGFGSDIHLAIYECDRISWGPFERGPISMVWETHTNVRPPERCDEGARDQFSVLHALWMNDELVLQYVNSTYGLPTRFAQFANNDTRTSQTQHVDWTWQVPGYPASRLQYDQALVTPGRARAIERMAWIQNSTVWTLDLDQQRTLTNGQTVLTPGTLQPPTLYSESGETQYLGRGAASLDAELSATLKKFGDLECKLPQ